MKKIRNISFVVFCCMLVCACKEKYVPELKEITTDFLVVDGFINSGVGPTTISLSRTTTIYNAPKIVRETKATVRVEGKNNTAGFALTEISPGVYSNPQLNLTPTDQYRVTIKTANGKIYMSGYSDVRRTPDIDSIPWRLENDGVQIYADAHDDKNEVGYYQFKYDQTFEFNSRYEQTLKMLRDATGRPVYIDFIDPFTTWRINQAAYTCWRYDTIYNINIYSTEKLTKNRVSMFPIVYFERHSEPLTIRYSMHLKMNSISKEGYHFLEQLKKNTQQLGSIFDAQPSENFGNVQCISNPGERVIGFVEVSEEKTKRIFINNSQLPAGWKYVFPCEEQRYLANLRDDVKWYREDIEWITTPYTLKNDGSVDTAFVASRICVDCTMRGTNVKPTFW